MSCENCRLLDLQKRDYEQLLSAAGQWLHALAPNAFRASEVRELADKIFAAIKGNPVVAEKRKDAPIGKAWDWLGSMPDLPEPPKEA